MEFFSQKTSFESDFIQQNLKIKRVNIAIKYFIQMFSER